MQFSILFICLLAVTFAADSAVNYDRSRLPRYRSRCWHTRDIHGFNISATLHSRHRLPFPIHASLSFGSSSCHLSCHIHYYYIHPALSFPATPASLAPDLHTFAYVFPIFSHGNTARRQVRKQLDFPRGLETCSCARTPGSRRGGAATTVCLHPPSPLACDTISAHLTPAMVVLPCRILEPSSALLSRAQGYKAYGLLVCLLFQLSLVHTHARATVSHCFPSWSLHRFGNIRRLVLRWLL